MQTPARMKSFACQCGNTLYLDSTQCLRCGEPVGFLWEDGALCTVTGEATEWQGRPISKCSNWALGICNWYTLGETSTLCHSCGLTHVVPDLSIPDNVTKLGVVEAAKRRLVTNLAELGLQVWPKEEGVAHGLSFEIRSPIGEEKVITGHNAGLITLNLEEADPVHREKQRCKLGEQYRTILGHLRHEIGHYFFDRLIASDTKNTAAFRKLFGDERQDYSEALKTHYDAGPPEDWADHFISPYAASHPWEDWAETWAHYLHSRAVAETARLYVTLKTTPEIERGTAAFMEGSVERADFEAFLSFWDMLAVAMNELNRSLGVNEPYPFQWTAPVAEKLYFIHRIVRAEQPAAEKAA